MHPVCCHLNWRGQVEGETRANVMRALPVSLARRAAKRKTVVTDTLISHTISGWETILRAMNAEERRCNDMRLCVHCGVPTSV